MRLGSIRARLLLWQITALVLTGLLISAITYRLAWNGFNRLRDYSLEQIAYSVLRHGVAPEPGEDGAAEQDQGQFVSQIWDRQGRLVYASQPDVTLRPQEDGPHVLRSGDDEWHVYTLRRGGLTIQVAHTTASRSEMFAGIIPWLMLPLAVLVAALGALIWIAVGRALRPLERVRTEIGERDALALHPVDARALPEEVAPLVGALNALLARLDAALTLQRRFIADAAHELRTPMTAVRLQAQIAQQARSPEEREAALAQLLAAVDRAAHLVQQLLDMARLAREAGRPSPVPVALDQLAKGVVIDFSSQADAAGIDLGLGTCVPTSVMGQPEALRVLLGNLVDNALRYTPRGGRVDVEVSETPEAAVITVQDNGPGIPLSERERVFDRFHRLSGAEVPGSGLGLAIVREVANEHGGHVRLLDSPGGGLAARVEFPRAEQAAGSRHEVPRPA